MRFPSSFLDDIRDRLRISEVVGARVTFDKKKTNAAKGDFWGCCPFHGEKTPSFHCEDRKGRYHCFGCGVSGDHFKFVTELDGLGFPEAVELLAGQAGLAMPIMDKAEQQREEARATLFDVMELATKFFEDQLQHANGAKARAYLRDRGLRVDVQQEFRLGYAPESRNALKEFLASKNIPQDQVEGCGLVVFGPDIAVSYDRFRDRVMFPIPDSRGRVIAFGGRALRADVPAKYLNSPETVLFHKSNVLYNFAKARKPAFDKKQVIVAEGYMDVIALHAAGFPHAVAPLGTALTEPQMNLLWRMHDEPILCFDGDGAGIAAAYRAADMALPSLAPGRSVRFAMLPDGLDPDDLIRESGPDAMDEVLSTALPLADLIWNRETAKGVYDTPERKAELEARLKQIVTLIRDESVRYHYSQDVRDRLARYFGNANRSGGNNNQRRNNGGGNYSRGNGQQGRRNTDGTIPMGQLGQSGRIAASSTLLNSKMMKSNPSNIPLRESVLVAGLVFHPAVAIDCFDEVAGLTLQNKAARQIQTIVLDVLATWDGESEQPDLDMVLAAVAKAGLEDVVKRMERQLREGCIWQSLPEAAFEDARDGWKQAYALHQRNHALSKELRLAERALADDDSQENLDRFLEIQKELEEVEGTEAIIEGFGLSSGRKMSGM